MADGFGMQRENWNNEGKEFIGPGAGIGNKVQAAVNARTARMNAIEDSMARPTIQVPDQVQPENVGMGNKYYGDYAGKSGDLNRQWQEQQELAARERMGTTIQTAPIQTAPIQTAPTEQPYVSPMELKMRADYEAKKRARIADRARFSSQAANQ